MADAPTSSDSTARPNVISRRLSPGSQPAVEVRFEMKLHDLAVWWVIFLAASLSAWLAVIAPSVGSDEFVQRNRTGRPFAGAEHVFDSSHRVRGKQNVAAHGTHVSGHAVKDDHLALVPYRMHNFSRLVLSPATFDTAFHFSVLLCTGVTHLGGFGSYTVMTISVGRDVVHTT